MPAAASGRTIVTVGGSSQPGNYTRKALAVVDDELVKLGFVVTSFDGATPWTATV